jgi:O-antigen ligase
MFMLAYCARPEDWVPHMSAIPLAKITGMLLILAFLFSLGQVRGRFPKELLYLALLSVQLFLTVPFSPVWRGGAFWASVDFVKFVIVVFIIVWVLNTMARLRQIIYLQTLCVTIATAVSVWKGQLVVGRLMGVLHGNYDNANDLALQIVICLPFCAVFLIRTRSPIRKLAWSFVILFLAYAVLLTGSRGGLLAAMVMFAALIWEFAIKGRHRFLLIIAMIGLVFVGLKGGTVLRRFGALGQGDEDPTAYASARARGELLRKSLEVTAHYPIFGIGPGNFPVVSGNWHVTHNSYTEMSSEGGLPALILYLMILWRAFVNVQSVKKYRKGMPEHRLWAKALYASLLAFLIGSFFASDAYQGFTYFLVAYTSALLLIARRERAVSAVESAAIDYSSPDEGTQEQGSGSEPAWSSS